jgi:TonB-linked SusC/RagA family outer membrane protein
MQFLFADGLLQRIYHACNFQTIFRPVTLLILVISHATVWANNHEVANDNRPKIIRPNISITGKVNDEQGNPLQGASVKIKGSDHGTTTDASGRFSLANVDTKSILVVTFIGFETNEFSVGDGRNLQIKLKADTRQLGEIVVSGYSSQKKKEFTGSAARVSGEQLANRPVPSFDQALAGQAAGVSITSNGGAIGATPVFRIRGFNSITLSSYPLIIIDGVPMFTDNVGNTAQNSPLADINPNDIESLDILKDASATAIYGSRAANGVVVITTKRGKKGKAKITYDGWIGANTPPRLPQLLGAADYVAIKNEAMTNAGLAPAYNVQKAADGSTIDTRWYDYLYHTGLSQSHNVSVAGATDATSYFVSAGFTDQNGFIVKNSFDRKSLRFNIDHHITKAFTIGVNASYSNSVNANLTSGIGSAFALNNLTREVMVLPPNLSPYNPDGSWNINGNSIGYGANTILSGYYNPVPVIENDKYTSESNNLIANIYADYEIFKGLKIKTSYSLNNLSVENKSFSNPYQGGGFSTNGSATNSSIKNKRSDWTTTLNYGTSIGEDHNFSILGGYEEIHTNTNNWGVTRQNLNDRYFTTFEGSFSTISSSSGSLGENGFKSFFSSLNYNFRKKYLFSGSFRRDGFSGLANGLQYGNFGGGSMGWNIFEEAFFKDSKLSDVFSSLRVRGSYGQVGNLNGIGDFPSLSLYSSGVYGAVAALSFSQAGNKSLTWETSKKTDFGLNFGLWNERLTVEADYFYNNIDGMILNADQAPSRGIPGSPSNSITTNVGSMYNKGLELTLNGQMINSRDFRWTSNINVSLVKNRVTSLANNNKDIIGSSGLESSNITRVGNSLGSIFVVRTTGINPDNGLRMYLNNKGETVQYNPVGSKWTYLSGATAPTLDGTLDGTIVGAAIPTWFGGFNNTFTYKQFDIFAGFVFSGGNKMYNGTKATLMDQRFFNNQTDVLRRWTKPGDITDVPKLVYGDQYASGSTLPHSANVEDGSYMKLKSASIGYTLPAGILANSTFSSVRFYGMVTNILLWTKYTGSDPEISANGNSNTAPGADKNSVPAGRSFTFGVTVNL